LQIWRQAACTPSSTKHSMQACYLMSHGNDAEIVKLPAYNICDSVTGLYVTVYEPQSRLVHCFLHAIAAQK